MVSATHESRYNYNENQGWKRFNTLVVNVWAEFEFMYAWHQASPGSSAGKESTCNAGDVGPIPGLGRSPGEGKGYPLQYSGLENSMDCIAHGVAKSQTQLSNFHCHEVPSTRNVSSRMEHPLSLHLAMTTAPLIPPNSSSTYHCPGEKRKRGITGVQDGGHRNVASGYKQSLKGQRGEYPRLV